MKTLRQPAPRLQFPIESYRFLFAALRFTQQRLGRLDATTRQEEDSHISGVELLEGIRDFAQQQFGLLAQTVFRTWGVNTTEDFGKMVFELIERGEMRKTDHDRLADFMDVYDFEETFQKQYKIDLRHVESM